TYFWLLSSPARILVFLFTYSAHPDIYTLSLHDALPILAGGDGGGGKQRERGQVIGHHPSRQPSGDPDEQPFLRLREHRLGRALRSEEHTSELQSLTNLVCRLLLENKNTPHSNPHTPPSY